MRKIFAFIALLLIYGCATEANYKKVLESWIGYPESMLVEKWGVPDKVYNQSDGTKLLQYARKSTVDLPKYETVMKSDGTWEEKSSSSGGGTLHYSCRTTFKIRNDTIISYNYAGNGCKQMESNPVTSFLDKIL